MKKYGLVSKYTLKHPKKRAENTNNDPTPNKVRREFPDRRPLEVVASDLTYIKCAGRWHYICLLLDLGRRKDAQLVRTASYGVQTDLRRIHLFHADRGSEFKNKMINEMIAAFGMERSLSAKGKPIDNAVAESMYNIVKTESAYGVDFADVGELVLTWFDYVNWYNNVRIHGSLGYLSTMEYEF